MKIPELLMPAGSPHKLRVAIEYGADAVYCGVPRYSLRARENEFRLHNLAEAVEFVRGRGKKIYFTVNAIPRNSKVPGYLRYLKAMADLKPNALIMADLGLIMITRDNFPDLPVHISVQANVMKYAAVDFWHRFGAKRVILSREVTLAEVREIHQRCPDIEIEVFVHGSICIAHSGRCFMSNYFKNRDANQGACNNACRDSYQVYLKNPDKEGNTRYQSHYYIGCVKRQDADGIAWFDLKNRLTEGDTVEVFFPGQFASRLFTAGRILRGVRRGLRFQAFLLASAVLVSEVGLAKSWRSFSFHVGAFQASRNMSANS
jgi:collagenase-like PrtC family protease